MRVLNIHLDEEALPDLIQFEMTRPEAVYLGLLIGRQSGKSANEIMPGGDAVNPDIWQPLNVLFNQFWDDGVRDAEAGL